MARTREQLLQMLSEGASLAGQDFGRVRLKGAALPGAKLAGIKLAGADLEDVDLTGADLSGADLSGCKLGGARLLDAALPGADLRRARLRQTDLSGADLSGARLQRLDLTGATLHRARLTSADLTEAILSSCQLEDADLGGAILVRATMDGLHLTRARLTAANLEEAYLERAQLVECDLSEANLRRANLVRARMERPTLVKTQLAEADLAEIALLDTTLVEVDLTQAIFDQAELRQVRFERCQLKGADFQGAMGLTPEEMEALKAQGAVVSVLALGKLVGELFQRRWARTVLVAAALLALGGFIFYYTRASQQPIEAVLVHAQELRKEGKADEALLLYDTLLAEVAGKPDQELQILQLKAEVLLELGRAEEAAEIYESLASRQGTDKDEAVTARLRLGALLVERGEYDKAATTYQALTTDPEVAPSDVARALIGLAGVYQKMGFDDKALEVAREARSRYPDNPAIALSVNRWLARALMERDQFSEAEAILTQLEEFVHDDSDRAELLMSRARLYSAMGDEARAYKAFEELARQFPDNPEVTPEVRLELAQLLMERGDFEHAERIFRDLTEKGPTEVVRQQAAVALGKLLSGLGQNLKALDVLDGVLASDNLSAEDRGNAQMARIDVLLRLGRADEAALGLRELVNAPERGQAGPALLRLAELQRERGETAAAAATYREIQEKFPGREELLMAARQGLAALSADQGNWAEAISSYQALLAQGGTPDERSALYQAIGQAQFESNDLAGAEATWRAMQTELTDEEARARASFGLAQIAVARGNIEEAARLYRQVAEGVEDLTLKSIALESLARTWMDAGREADAILTYQEMVDKVPAGHDAAFTARMGLAAIYAQRRDLEQARKLYQAAIDGTARGNKKVAGLLALATVLRDTGNPSQAQEIYDRILTQYNGVADASLQARLGMAELARAQGDLEKAARLYKEVAQEGEDPTLVTTALQAQAQVLESLGRGEEARALQQQILRRFGSDPETAFNAKLATANARRQDGDLAGALAAYQALLAETADPGLQLQLLDSMAGAMAELGQLEEAARTYQTLMERSASQADLLHNAMMGLAGIRRAQGRPDDAVVLYRQVSEQTLDRAMQAWALESVAQVAADKGDMVAAAASYQAIIDRFGDDAATVAGARLGLGQLKRRQGDVRGAREQFEKVAADSQDLSQKAWATLYIAQALAEQDALDQALSVYLDIPRSFAGEAEVVINARLGLADLYRVKGKNEDAAKIYEELSKGSGFSEYRVTALQGLAGVALDKGDVAAARAAYDQILSRFSSLPEAVFNARLGLARLKIREGAASARSVIPQLTALVESTQDPTLKVWARQALAQAQMAAGEKDAARASWQALLREGSEQPDIMAEARAALESL